MENHLALLAVFVRSRVDELVGWRAVSKLWNEVITSPDLLLERRRFRLPVEPLLLYHPEMLFGSTSGAIARYSPSQAVDTTSPETQPPMAIVAAASSNSDLEYDTTYRILMLCRATDLVLLRRVSRQWRDIISSPKFALDYRDRRAPQPMLMLRPDFTRNLADLLANPAATRSTLTPPDSRLLYIESFEEIHTGPSPGALLQVEGDHRLLNLHACFDGVMLVSYSGHLFAVNSVTRRGVRLPPIHTGASILALFHGCAHEDYNPDYCVLYCGTRKPVDSYAIFSISTRESQNVGCPAPSAEVKRTLVECMPDSLRSPLVIQEVVYWLQGYSAMILLFNTNSWQFSLLSPPLTTGARFIQVLDMKGKLALATIGLDAPTVNIWVHHPEWYRLYHIELPQQVIEVSHPFDFYDYYAASADGDVFVDTTGCVLHFDCSGVLLGRYEHGNYHVTVIQHQMRKSLLPLCR